MMKMLMNMMMMTTMMMMRPHDRGQRTNHTCAWTPNSAYAIPSKSGRCTSRLGNLGYASQRMQSRLCSVHSGICKPGLCVSGLCKLSYGA
eukprot:1146016-Karenia_brevis.AAC.1